MYLPRDEGTTITRRSWRRLNGVSSDQGLVEYALMLVLVAIVVIAIRLLVGPQTSVPAVVTSASAITASPDVANIFSKITKGWQST